MTLDENYDTVTEGIYDIQNAVDDLTGVSECEEIIDILNEMLQELLAIQTGLQERQAERDALELEQMKSDYWRDVM